MAQSGAFGLKSSRMVAWRIRRLKVAELRSMQSEWAESGELHASGQ